MATKLYKQTFKGRRAADVHDEIGRRGGIMVRLDQSGDTVTAYFEADDRAGAAGKAAEGATEVTLDDVMKI